MPSKLGVCNALQTIKSFRVKINILLIFELIIFFSSLPYQALFGGAGSFTREHFELINGFSNEFWGWGGEDDDLYQRYNQCISINKPIRSFVVLHVTRFFFFCILLIFSDLKLHT